MTRAEIFRETVKKWGVGLQFDTLIEEMAELTKAIIKYKRNSNAGSLLEEIADVEIMLEQIRSIFGAETNKVIDIHKADKLNRVENLLMKEKTK